MAENTKETKQTEENVIDRSEKTELDVEELDRVTGGLLNVDPPADPV